MNEIEVFKNDEFGQLRTLLIGNKPYVVAIDVARALGYKDTTNAIKQHCRYAVKRPIQHPQSSDPSKSISVNCIPEKDILNLIACSETACSSYKDEFLKWLKQIGIIKSKILVQTRAEVEFIDVLKKVLEPFGYTIHTQYQVLHYFVDIYIEDLNIVVEYDEDAHKHYNKMQEGKREKEIKEKLGCEIIRVTNKDSHLWNCGYVIKEIGGKLHG